MPTVTRKIRTDRDRAACIALINHKPLPITVRIKDGEDRSSDQNRLQWLWMTEIAQQLGDQTPAQVQAYCKLTIGVPILRAADDKWREAYDMTVKGLTYEQKLLMMEKLDFPVTRAKTMTTSQMTQYLNTVWDVFTEQGVILTETSPDW